MLAAPNVFGVDDEADEPIQMEFFYVIQF